MIESFTKAWFANIHKMRDKFSANHPDGYEQVVSAVVQMLHDSAADTWDEVPDPSRIHAIDDGDYQGVLVYVIAETGYQPRVYWYVKIDYGSCSGCDTLQSITQYSGDPPNDAQVSEYMQLALHVVQGIKRMGDDE
jgi:hypothetical protein